LLNLNSYEQSGLTVRSAEAKEEKAANSLAVTADA